MAQRIYSLELELGVQLYPEMQIESLQKNECRPFFEHLLQTIMQRNDLVLAISPEDKRVYLHNGGCVYADGLRNLEYSLPECASIREALACEQAASRILEQTAQELEQVIQQQYPKARVFVYKNNIARDRSGKGVVSYGTHENYSLKKQGLQFLFWQRKKELENTITEASHAFGGKDPCYFDEKTEADFPYIFVNALLLPFLATRPLLCGAGSITEQNGGGYELSQRAPFIKEDISQCTTSDRGLGNVRSEDHARDYYRIHLICGDANMLEYSTFLKLGTTGLLLRMIEEDALLQQHLVLQDSVETHQEVSKDTKLLNSYQLFYQGRKEFWSAIDIQLHYYSIAQAFIAAHGGSKEEEEVLAAWKYTLNSLIENPKNLIGKVDWVTKKYVLEQVKEKKNLEWVDPVLQNRNVQYHLLGQKLSLFYALLRKHPEWRMIPEEEVQKYMHNPPQTRAEARRAAVHALHARKCVVKHVSWQRVQGIDEETKTTYTFMLNNPFATKGDLFSFKEKEKTEYGKS